MRWGRASASTIGGVALALALGSAGNAVSQGEPGAVVIQAIARNRSAFSAVAREPRSLSDGAGEWSLALGFEQSRGDFNDSERTDIRFAPLTLRYQRGPWLASLTVPYIRIRGPGDIVGGLDSSLVVAREAAGKTTESGLGDVVAGVAYAIDPPREWLPFVELSARVKFPTADEDERLGTGEADYRVQIDLARSLGRFTPFAALGYRVLGDPSGVDLDEGYFGSLGGSYRFSPALSAGLALDAEEASTDGVDAPRELVSFGSYRWSRSLTLGSYAVFGLSDSSPDLALGMTARVSW
jgi:hypothetical protein